MIIFTYPKSNSSLPKTLHYELQIYFTQATNKLAKAAGSLNKFLTYQRPHIYERGKKDKVQALVQKETFIMHHFVISKHRTRK